MKETAGGSGALYQRASTIVGKVCFEEKYTLNTIQKNFRTSPHSLKQSKKHWMKMMPVGTLALVVKH